MGSCFVEVELKVVKENGQTLTREDVKKIQPTNDFFNAMFSNVDVLINGNTVGTTLAPHPQTALLHNLLDCDESFQNNVLSMSNIWLKDYEYPAANSGIRHRYIEGSKCVKLFGRLNHNTFTTRRLLLPKVSMQIKMRRSDSAYCLIRTEGVEDEYKVEVQACKLSIRRVLYYDSVLERIDRHLKTQSIQYPYTKTMVHRFPILQGTKSMRSISTGWGPAAKRAFFAICEPESIEGRNWENNPMIFPASHYNVDYVQFVSEYDDVIQERPYKPDFEDKSANKAYTELVHVTTDGFRSGRLPGLTCDDFVGQYGLFAMGSMHDSTDLAVKIGFKKATPRPLMGLIFVQRDAYFTIANAGGVMNE